MERSLIRFLETNKLLKMNKKIITLVATLLILGILLMLSSCNNTAKKTDEKEMQKPFMQVTLFHFLIIGN